MIENWKERVAKGAAQIVLTDNVRADKDGKVIGRDYVVRVKKASFNPDSGEKVTEEVLIDRQNIAAQIERKEAEIANLKDILKDIDAAIAKRA